MVINRNTWHYKLYDFTYSMSSSYTRSQTNLCQYVRRTLLMTPIIALCWAVLAVFVVFICVCFYLFGPIFGWLPRRWNAAPWTIFDTDGTYKYQGLKLGKKYNSFQLYPWHVLLVAIVIGFEWVIYHYFGSHPLVVEAEVVGVIVLAAGIIIGLLVYLDSDTGRVVNEYIAAKKQRVCPIVEFTDKE